jgi:hypothetical protein
LRPKDLGERPGRGARVLHRYKRDASFLVHAQWRFPTLVVFFATGWEASDLVPYSNNCPSARPTCDAVNGFGTSKTFFALRERKLFSASSGVSLMITTGKSA